MLGTPVGTANTAEPIEMQFGADMFWHKKPCMPCCRWGHTGHWDVHWRYLANVRPSVCLSVTRRYCIETDKRIELAFSTDSSLGLAYSVGSCIALHYVRTDFGYCEK